MLFHEAWVREACRLACSPPAFRDGGRKIFRNHLFTVNNLDGMSLTDGGYTQTKMTMLKRLYYVEESIAVAKELWDFHLQRGTYKSASFTCYGHNLKNKGVHAPKAKHASVMGPCLQSVILTQKPNGKRQEVDLLYRTSELVKKFSADVVFIRDLLLPNFTLGKVDTYNFYFTNLTLHFMYFPILFAHMARPVEELQRVREADEGFHDLIVKSSARFLIPEYTRGIERHSQSMHVHKQVNAQLSPGSKKRIIEYVHANHKGYKKPYVPPKR